MERCGFVTPRNSMDATIILRKFSSSALGMIPKIINTHSSLNFAMSKATPILMEAISFGGVSKIYKLAKGHFRTPICWVDCRFFSLIRPREQRA
jgi:hypothetical protein